MHISGLLPLNQEQPETRTYIIMGPRQKVVPLYIGYLATVFLYPSVCSEDPSSRNLTDLNRMSMNKLPSLEFVAPSSSITIL